MTIRVCRRFLALLGCFLYASGLSAQEDTVARFEAGRKDSLPVSPAPSGAFSFSLPARHWLIGVGNPDRYYAGIRLNAVDHGVPTHGINIAFWNNQLSSPAEKCARVNGIELNLFLATQWRVNGLAMALFISQYDHMNGICYSGLIGETDRMNGILLGGLFHLAEKNNGFSFVLADQTLNIQNGVAGAGIVLVCDSVINGIGFSPVFTRAEKVNGLSLASFNFVKQMNGLQFGIMNRAERLDGFQFGLVNIVKENPRWCRVLPLLNANFGGNRTRIDTLPMPDGFHRRIVKYRFDNRTVHSTESWLNGVRDGDCFYYDEKGRLARKETYASGTVSGTWYVYDKNGRIVSESARNDTGFHRTYVYYGERRVVYESRDTAAEFDRTYTVFHGDTLNGMHRGKKDGKWPERETETFTIDNYYCRDTLLLRTGVYTGKTVRVLKAPAGETFTLQPGDTCYMRGYQPGWGDRAVCDACGQKYLAWCGKEKEWNIELNSRGWAVTRKTVTDGQVIRVRKEYDKNGFLFRSARSAGSQEERRFDTTFFPGHEPVVVSEYQDGKIISQVIFVKPGKKQRVMRFSPMTGNLVIDSLFSSEGRLLRAERVDEELYLWYPDGTVKLTYDGFTAKCYDKNGLLRYEARRTPERGYSNRYDKQGRLRENIVCTGEAGVYTEYNKDGSERIRETTRDYSRDRWMSYQSEVLYDYCGELVF